MALPINGQSEVATVDIVRSEQLRDLLDETLKVIDEENLVNVSFMIEPAQKEAIGRLAKANRLSQGVILRIIIREWMENKLNGC